MNAGNDSRRVRTIGYTFTFADGEKIQVTIRLDADTLDYIAAPKRELPDWAELEFCKCPHCPLDPAVHKYCPVAANLSDVTQLFDGMKSHVEVDVKVENSERTVMKHTSLQVGASALIGLIMPTSGCPILNRLRPLTAMHLPFSTPEETSYRLTCMYLFAQYFKKQRFEVPDWDLSGMTEFLTDIELVNEHICKRLNAMRTSLQKGSSSKVSTAKISDVLLNAVNILNTSEVLAEISIKDDDLEYWKRIFNAHH